jgi:hypothetical protein
LYSDSSPSYRRWSLLCKNDKNTKKGGKSMKKIKTIRTQKELANVLASYGIISDKPTDIIKKIKKMDLEDFKNSFNKVFPRMVFDSLDTLKQYIINENIIEKGPKVDLFDKTKIDYRRYKIYKVKLLTRTFEFYLLIDKTYDYTWFKTAINKAISTVMFEKNLSKKKEEPIKKPNNQKVLFVDNFNLFALLVPYLKDIFQFSLLPNVKVEEKALTNDILQSEPMIKHTLDGENIVRYFVVNKRRNSIIEVLPIKITVEDVYEFVITFNKGIKIIDFLKDNKLQDNFDYIIAYEFKGPNPYRSNKDDEIYKITIYKR